MPGSRHLILLLAILLLAPAANADRSKSREQRTQEEIGKATRRLGKLSNTTSPEMAFVRNHSAKLLDRLRAAPAGSYQNERLLEALDDLLDAGEQLMSAEKPGRKDRDDDDREETARDLERAYFRVTQADYFARMCRERNAEEYVKLARRLYQSARREYDRKEYRRARRLGDAAAEIVNTLENLAQAAVRIPEPPKLED